MTECQQICLTCKSFAVKFGEHYALCTEALPGDYIDDTFNGQRFTHETSGCGEWERDWKKYPESYEFTRELTLDELKTTEFKHAKKS